MPTAMSTRGGGEDASQQTRLFATKMGGGETKNFKMVCLRAAGSTSMTMLLAVLCSPVGCSSSLLLRMADAVIVTYDATISTFFSGVC